MKLKKLIKKLVTIIAASTILITSSIGVEAESSNKISQQYKLDAYIESSLEGYVSLMFDEDDMVYASKPITIHNWDTGNTNKQAVFVFDNDKIVGQLTISEINGEFYSSYSSPDYIDVINDMYRNKTDFVIGSEKGYFILDTQSKTYTLHNTNIKNDEEENIVLSNVKTNVKNETERSSIVKCNNTVNISNKRSINYMAPVPHVDPDPFHNKTCWAACVASMTNYKKGTSYTANNVYVDCWASVSYDPNNKPSGTYNWINTAYGLYNVSLSYLNSGLTGSSVVSYISWNRPIHIGVTDTTLNAGHGLVIAGVTSTGSGGYYYLMDTNESNYVTIYVNSTNWNSTSNFAYVTSYDNYNFNHWDTSRF